jgi:hypothetical protein
MEPPKKEKTLEIAQRTRKNLEYIYRAKQNSENVEEFTQLLNSMLGMVISLREDYFKGSHITWQYVEGLGLANWNHGLEIEGKAPYFQSPNLQKINAFSQLITNLRHAFAHCCFDLIIDINTKQITGITAWNVPPGKPKTVENRVWEADIMENELKSLAYLFIEYLEKELDA